MNERNLALDLKSTPNDAWTLDHWLYFLENRHKQAIQLRLINAARVANSLDVLQWSIPVITVGGTNGKGSTVTALSAIYQAAGYRVGQFTSPHLFRFNERICINQQPIADADLCRLFSQIEIVRAETSLTYFEMSLLAALLYFKEADLDVVILEVGVGGRLDATNIIDADLAIVTTVDLDHQDLLGLDKEAIGKEKAGIFRQGRPGIYADFLPPASLLRHAEMLETELLCLDKHFHFCIEDNQLHIEHFFQADPLRLPLPALHPHAAVSAVIATLCLQSHLPICKQDWVTALQTMCIRGRQHWVPGDVSFLYDVAHNPQAVAALVQCIEKKLAEQSPSLSPPGKIHAVFSALKDKDICGLIKPLSSIVEQWYPACLSGERAANSEQLQMAFNQALDVHLPCYDSPIQATQAALAAAKPGDWIVVYGSFLLVSAVMAAHIQG